jgi:hypothetical protein
LTRQYEITAKGDPAAKLEQFKELAKKADMYFRGDTHKGEFNGGPMVLGFHIVFKGNYVVENKKITITIEEKPALVSWELVEKTIKEFFAE